MHISKQKNVLIAQKAPLIYQGIFLPYNFNVDQTIETHFGSEER